MKIEFYIHYNKLGKGKKKKKKRNEVNGKDSIKNYFKL